MFRSLKPGSCMCEGTNALMSCLWENKMLHYHMLTTRGLCGSLEHKNFKWVTSESLKPLKITVLSIFHLMYKYLFWTTVAHFAHTHQLKPRTQKQTHKISSFKLNKQWNTCKAVEIRMAERENSWADAMCNPLLGVHAYKIIQHSSPVKVPLWSEESLWTWPLLKRWLSLRWVLGRRGATRHCSSGAASAAASRDTRRFSARGRALLTVPSGRRYASSRAGTCHQFPVRWQDKCLTDTLICFYYELGNVNTKNIPTWSWKAVACSSNPVALK